MNKKPLFPIFIGLVILAAAGGYLLFRPSTSPGPRRFQLPSFAAENQGAVQTDRCQLDWDHPHIYFQDGGQKSTFLGSVYNRPGKENSLPVRPGLQGSFVMDFFIGCLPLEGEERIARIPLYQTRDGKPIHEMRIRSDRNLKRFQVHLTLKKEDVLSLNFPPGRRGFVTNPLFYPPLEPKERPRFVFLIVADTLRMDDIGVYNPKVRYTPAIDRLARDSLVFTQAYSTSPWTLPAHASMFTGLFCTSHGINHRDTRLNGETVPLARLLQEKFITYSINGNGFLSSLYGFAQGFDFYREDPVDHLIRQASLVLFKRARKLVNNERHRYSFHFLHTYQIHAPYLPENRLFRELYGDTIRENQFDFKDLIQDRKNLYKSVPEEEREKIKKIYNGGVYTFDHHLGHFLDFLKQEELYDDSLVILTSDHGEEFLDHGAWLHGHSLYNELIQIPLILKLPENRWAGETRDYLVSITDLIPTIISRYGLKIPSGLSLDGRSLFDPDPDRYLVSYLGRDAMQVHLPEKLAIVTDPYKFIYNQSMTPEDRAFFLAPPPSDPPYQIFDIRKDPAERFNVVNTRTALKKRFLQILENLNRGGGQKNRVNIEELKKSLETLGYL